MLNKTISSIILIINFHSFIVIAAPATNTRSVKSVLLYVQLSPNNPKTNEIFEDIESLRKSKDLAGLQKLCDRSLISYRNKHDSDDLRLLDEATAAIVSTDFGVSNIQKQADLACIYSVAVLDLEHGIPVDVAANFLSRTRLYENLQYANGLLKGKDWAELRKKWIIQYLDILKKMDDNIDRDYDVDKSLPVNVPPIPKDSPPSLVKRQQDELEKVNKEFMEHEVQVMLRQDKKDFLPVLEGYIVSSYSKQLFVLSELKIIMEEKK